MVEGARLESVYAGDRIVGSNPILSARFYLFHQLIREKLDFMFLFDILIFNLPDKQNCKFFSNKIMTFDGKGMNLDKFDHQIRNIHFT